MNGTEPLHVNATSPYTAYVVAKYTHILGWGRLL